ncbi:MAG: YobA family protein [Clostridium sp.]|nr:YobA family protein [Clostridium sp.]
MNEKRKFGGIMGSKKPARLMVALSAAVVLALSAVAVVLGARSGGSGTIDDLISRNEPHFRGIVTERSGNSILVEVSEGEEVRRSADLIWVSLDVVRKDGAFAGKVGDEVTVYYDGMIAESYPAQIHKVYAILTE